MKKNAILILLLFMGILIQTTIFHYLPIRISPDLSLIILVYFSFRYGSSTSQVTGFASGLMEDFLSLSPLGFNCFIKTVIGFLAGLFHERLMMDPIIFPIITMIIVTIVKGVLSAILIELFHVSIDAVMVFSNGFFLEIIVNALLGPLIFQLLRILLDWLFPERKTI